MRVAQRLLPLAVTLLVTACATAAPKPGTSPAPEAAPPRAVPPDVAVSAAPSAPVPRSSASNAAQPPDRTVRLGADGKTIEPAVPGARLKIPDVDGPVGIRVVYPPPNYVIPARDSNFLLGSVGSGKAKLTINGHDVPVQPNGAFLAWIPVPPREAPVYSMVATKETGERAETEYKVRRPPLPMPLPEAGALVVDKPSAQPTGALRLRGDERVRFSIRAPANASVLLAGEGKPHEMTRGNGGTVYSADLPASVAARFKEIRVKRGKESIAVPVAKIAVVDPDERQFVELLNDNVDAKSDTDEVVILRPTPAGTYKWFLHPHTVVEATGQRGAWTRVRLADDLEAWLDSSHVKAASRHAPVLRTAANARVAAGAKWSDLRIPMSERPPFLVEQAADALVLTLYGTQSNIDIINFPTNDAVIHDVRWEQVTADRVRITVHLRQPPYGYLTLWENGAFILRVRRPPTGIDPSRPLAGRVIAVDPGHPPIGSTGPTGLYEGDATLAVAQALKPMLESEGAIVVMTRTTRDPVALGERPIISRRADADAFVSIHLNAHPDGVNPNRTNGSGTYYFLPQAAGFARHVQRGLVRWMGLRDLGVNYDNLAVARATWMPSILCEGAFVILPDQEAALRTSEFQSRYAIGILEGLENYFRELANQR